MRVQFLKISHFLIFWYAKIRKKYLSFNMEANRKKLSILFKFSYWKLCLYLDCRCIFTGPSGSIVTHNATRYQRNSRSQCCSWLITAKETLQILLSFSRLTVPQCNFASLTIYNGRNDTSFVLGNYCGENATAGIKVLSSKNHLFLVTNFWSYGSHPKKVFTFRAKYYATQLEGLILIFSNYFLCN